MFKGKFGKYAIAFCILGIVYNFMYSGLQNDQINILQGFSAWNDGATLAPLTAGNVVAILMTFVYGSLFIKFGPRKVLIPCIIVSALGCVGIAFANGLAAVSKVTVASAAVGDASVLGNYTLYAVSLFCIRITAQCFQLAGFMMASNWFIKYRGRVLGIITMGSPLFSVIGTSVMSTFIAKNLGGDYRPFYFGIAVILVVLAVLTGALLKDKPEDDGLFPDGEDHAPLSEAEQADVASLGEVVVNPKTWVMIINFGCFNFIINACMASMVAWFTHLALTYGDIISTGPLAGAYGELGPMVLFLGQAAKWLSVGAILGIPMSFVFGWIDDKLGTPIACIVLGLTELIPITGLLVQKSAVASTGSCNVAMLILWGFGVACMTGGVPTMNPASVGYAFGRREYATASRFVLAIQLIPMAFAAQIMVSIFNGANDVAAWYMLYAIVAVGIIFCLPMFKWGDAMAADRG